MTLRFMTLLSAGLLASALSGAETKAPCTPQSAIDIGTIGPQIIIVGEMHGTEQAPRFVSSLVCSLLQTGQGVIVALERNGAEQPALNRYLDSAGTPQDKELLWKEPGWRSAMQDGRSSAAVMALIDDMRSLRGSGHRVGLLAMQQATTSIAAPLSAREKTPLPEADAVLFSRINDRSMANSLLSVGALYGGFKIVALAGGVHTATQRPAWAEPHYVPMGALVRAERPAYFIGLKAEGGTAWTCRSGKPCAAGPVGPGSFVTEGTHIDTEVSLGALTASPPAAPVH